MKTIIPKEECINTESALRREWLETNGLGGYASSTIINCHTRKYHGYLVAALDNPKGRHVLLSKIEGAIHTDREDFHLSTNKFPGVFHPTGHKYVEQFEYGLYPAITFRIADVLLKKSIVMIYGENTVMVRYRLVESEGPVVLHLKPLLAYRPMHELMRENMHIQIKTYTKKNGFKIEPYQGMPPLYFYTNRQCMFYPGPEWNFSLEYLKERRRGYPYQEDLFAPGLFEVTLKKGHDVILCASTGPKQSQNLEKIYKAEKERREKAFASFTDSDSRLKELKYLSDQFIIKNRRKERSIIAGYHWFGEWGRDTMIALPGLTFCCGRMKEGLEILQTFANHEKNGVIPNFIADEGEGDSFNSADATLWFFWGLQQYVAYGGKIETVREKFLPVMERIISSIRDGSNPVLKLLENGLISCGDEHTQLTWMDANSNGQPVTPRYGCPVEINALWYNALRFFAELSGFSDVVEKLAEKAGKAFEEQFWNEELGCLYDVVRDDYRDNAIRPNQIFAVSLPYSPLPEDKQKKTAGKVQRHLLTPYGLRSLSPGHPDYKSAYEGDQNNRDAAYHQGTVWAWLAGHFGEAWLKTAADRLEAEAFLKKELEPLLEQYPKRLGVNCIPEIYNGDPPHTPKGAISQAWSHAEVIRLKTLLQGD